MKKICLFNFKNLDSFGDYRIKTFDPMAYISSSSAWSKVDLLLWGLNGYRHQRALTASIAGVDRLYREKNPAYMRMVHDFVDEFSDYDLIVMSSYNFLHPEIIRKYLSKPIKVMGFIDDPYSTYTRGVPYLWAFDGAFYISPSYINELDFSENLRLWGARHTYFWPLVIKEYKKQSPVDGFFINRTKNISYIGNPSGSKVDRLYELKKEFKDDFVLRGRWPFRGYSGLVRGLFGKRIYPYRVISVSEREKSNILWDTKIGFNMHLSDHPYETGNMRMYEVCAHGAMLLCDKANMNLNENIFSSKEAVYYDSLKEAIELAKYYLVHDSERHEIARNGYERFWSEYSWDKSFKRFLDWALSLK